MRLRDLLDYMALAAIFLFAQLAFLVMWLWPVMLAGLIAWWLT